MIELASGQRIQAKDQKHANFLSGARSFGRSILEEIQVKKIAAAAPGERARMRFNLPYGAQRHPSASLPVRGGARRRPAVLPVNHEAGVPASGELATLTLGGK